MVQINRESVKYEKAGVREYWILDADAKRATFLTLLRDRFQEMPVENGVFHSKVLPGFYFEVRWIWDEKRPKAYDWAKHCWALLGDH